MISFPGLHSSLNPRFLRTKGTLRSKNTKNGLELCFSEGSEVISRVNATLDQNGIKAVLRMAEDLREWQHFVDNAIQRALETRAEQRFEAISKVPSM